MNDCYTEKNVLIESINGKNKVIFILKKGVDSNYHSVYASVPLPVTTREMEAITSIANLLQEHYDDGRIKHFHPHEWMKKKLESAGIAFSTCRHHITTLNNWVMRLNNHLS